MPAKVLTTEFGCAMSPVTPHSITVHMPGWETGIRFRAGDPAILSQFKSMYPRFGPWVLVRDLAMAIHGRLALSPDHGVLPLVNPDIFRMAKAWALSDHRKDRKLDATDLAFRVVDIHGVRLYVVVFPLAKAPGVMGVWLNPGTGVSSRLAELLLSHLDSFKEVPLNIPGDGDVSVEWLPRATWLPETEAHAGLKERIAGLMNRAVLQPEKTKVQVQDVFLYPTGMAAIYRLHETMMRWRKGPAVALGAIFHSTFHLAVEFPDGFKHFSKCEAGGDALEQLESYAKSEAKEGRKIPYVFLEFPSNPILVSVDLKRLRKIANENDFPIVVDDTIGSFCNIDLLPAADIIMSSLTKSFSGYADVMGGSLVLNPQLPYHSSLHSTFAANFHNEYFSGDAAHITRNSADYLPRSAILNRNAAAVASFLQARKDADPASGMSAVLYPTLSDTRAAYEAFMRRPTDEFAPGYGCLLSVDFGALADTQVFYDSLAFHVGPHLGAQEALTIAFNAIVWGKDPEEAAYHRSYGAREEQIRISVGLESEETLVDTVKAALDKVKEARAKAGGERSAVEVEVEEKAETARPVV